MFVLDTNHLREFTAASAAGIRLRQRMQACSEAIVTTVITAEESLRGWLARVNAADSPEHLVLAYSKLDQLIGDLGRLVRLPLDADAVERFQSFRKDGVRIATLDLRIACICLEHDATLLTRNIRDFGRIPDLKIENWLD